MAKRKEPELVVEFIIERDWAKYYPQTYITGIDKDDTVMDIVNRIYDDYPTKFSSTNPTKIRMRLCRIGRTAIAPYTAWKAYEIIGKYTLTFTATPLDSDT